MKILFAILFLVPLAGLAQMDSVISGSYKWRQPSIQEDQVNSVVLLEGKVRDFDWMQLSANTISAATEIKQTVPKKQEQLIIVKSGAMNIRFGDSTWLLTANSTAVLMPGEKFSLINPGAAAAHFITMKYSRNSTVNDAKAAGNSYVVLWENVPFKPNNNGGGRRDLFDRSTVLQKRFEIHVTTLKEGRRSHEPHTHRAEEIVLVIEGQTEMQIDEKFYTTNTGGFYYLGSNMLHAIKTTSTTPSTYFAIQFE